MDPCLKEMLRQRIYIARITWALDGSETTTAPIPVQAYVELDTSKIGAPGGTEKDSRHVIITEEEITYDHRIWLPGLDPSDLEYSRQAEAIVCMPDPETGLPHHYETIV